MDEKNPPVKVLRHNLEYLDKRLNNMEKLEKNIIDLCKPLNQIMTRYSFHRIESAK